MAYDFAHATVGHARGHKPSSQKAGTAVGVSISWVLRVDDSGCFLGDTDQSKRISWLTTVDKQPAIIHNKI